VIEPEGSVTPKTKPTTGQDYGLVPTTSLSSIPVSWRYTFLSPTDFLRLPIGRYIFEN